MNDLSENCYDLKRSALIASVVLIMISMIGPTIAPDATIFIFSVPQQAAYVAIALVALSCLYYNVSFLTTFYVESRNWQISTPSARAEINSAIAELKSASDSLGEQVSGLRTELSTIKGTVENFSRMNAESQAAEIGSYLSWNIEKLFEEKRSKASQKLFVAIDKRLHADRAMFENHEKYAGFAKTLAKELATELKEDLKAQAVSRADEIGSAIESRANFIVRTVQQSFLGIEGRLARHDRSLGVTRRILKRLEQHAARWKIAMNAKMYVFDLGVPVAAFLAAIVAISALMLRDF